MLYNEYIHETQTQGHYREKNINTPAIRLEDGYATLATHNTVRHVNMREHIAMMIATTRPMF